MPDDPKSTRSEYVQIVPIMTVNGEKVQPLSSLPRLISKSLSTGKENPFDPALYVDSKNVEGPCESGSDSNYHLPSFNSQLDMKLDLKCDSKQKMNLVRQGDRYDEQAEDFEQITKPLQMSKVKTNETNPKMQVLYQEKDDATKDDEQCLRLKDSSNSDDEEEDSGSCKIKLFNKFNDFDSDDYYDEEYDQEEK